MATYNFTDGVIGTAAFKDQLISLFTINELGSVSPYDLRWAGKAGSGWSFGVVH